MKEERVRGRREREEETLYNLEIKNRDSRDS